MMQTLCRLYDNRVVRWALIVVLSVIAAISVRQGVANALEFSQDFQWDAAKALSMRLDPYELSLNPEQVSAYPELEAFYRMFTDRGLKQQMEANQFPSLLMFLYPLTLLGPQTAKTVWVILNLLFTAGIIILLRKTFFEHSDAFGYAVITLIMLAGTPYRNQLGVGQHTLFAFFFFMLAVFFDKRACARCAGANSTLISVCLAVSYFKYTLTAPLALYFVYKKRYKELAASVAVHIVMTLGAAIWLQKSVIYMITAPLRVASALTAEGGIDLGVLLGKGSFAVAFAVAVFLTVMTVRLPEGKEELLFGVLILWSLILTYHRTYDFFVLSAVYILFSENVTECFGQKAFGILKIWYWVLTVSVYFLLRVFGENTPSKIVTGIIYYAFTFTVTYCLARAVIKEKQGRV